MKMHKWLSSTETITQGWYDEDILSSKQVWALVIVFKQERRNEYNIAVVLKLAFDPKLEGLYRREWNALASWQKMIDRG